MYYNTLLFGFLIVTLMSCEDKTIIQEEIKINKIEAEIPQEDNFHYDTLQGMYIGDFGGSDIRLIINYVSNKNAIGYNIHKGLQRNLTGKVTRNEDSVLIVLNEPGDHEFDGVFTLCFVGNDYEPTGIWKSNSGKLKERNFKLSKLIKPTKSTDDAIDISNFADYFSYLNDTIGDYFFKEDGLCIFEYYPFGDDEQRVEQMIEIRGSWSLAGKTVTIDWQPNKVFPKRKMIYKIISDEYGEQILEGNNHILYNNYW